jgi:hypothetical protein
MGAYQLNLIQVIECGDICQLKSTILLGEFNPAAKIIRQDANQFS